MKSLVIAEKPSVARDIARILKCGKNINGAIEGERYVVTWGLGHLVTLADPEDYDKKYKEWKMEDLPIMPEVFKIEVIKQTSKQYQAVKNQIYRGDVGDIIIATDAGREGELGIVFAGQGPGGIDAHQPVRLCPAHGCVVQVIVFPSVLQVCKSLPDSLISHG